MRVPILILVLLPGAWAQAQKFEVAAITRFVRAMPLSEIEGRRADFDFVSLTTLILRAYEVEPYQVIGPDWIGTTRFDIRATLPEGTTKEQMPEMLRELWKGPVVDRTGLPGFYEVALDVPAVGRRLAIRSGAMAPPEGGRPVEEASDPSGVSIFASIQKLGLKLERRKMAVDQLIVENVEKTPTEN